MGVSIRAYAQHRGVSHEAVRKAIAAGRITLEPDGTIDPAKADAQWNQRTRATTANAAAQAAGEDVLSANYHKARTVREAYAAKLAKLEYEERLGKLINADEVQVTVFNLARRLRDRMQQIPRQVSAQIVAAVAANPNPREVEDILDQAIRDALIEISSEDGGVRVPGFR
ncbi:elements of external origin [Thauera propionica]|uniref:elements of external origin n=1 Tax=Thauera propionica TaxID=2019431 RepID=UPI0023F1C356|nr:elements of external origin [Thauera propionica]MDD3677458.1 elements of external origin [Thauera propionica]